MPRLERTDHIDPTVPHSARLWNLLLAGKEHYPADRALARELAARWPGTADLARQCRYFQHRAVLHAARDHGIRQFLDIGTGLPTADNLHETAQHTTPDARCVLVDNDPLVMAFARAVLTSTTTAGATGHVQADLHDTAAVLAGAARTLDLTRPVAVILAAVLGHEPDLDTAASAVHRITARTAPGSILIHCDATGTPQQSGELAEHLDAWHTAPYALRSPAELTTFHQGMEILDPGIVQVSRWKPDNTPFPVPHVDAHGGISRKP